MELSIQPHANYEISIYNTLSPNQHYLKKIIKISRIYTQIWLSLLLFS